MNAWQTLVANSTAPDGSSAWVHLQNQRSGTGDIIIGGEITANIEYDLTMNVDNDLSANLISDTLTMTEDQDLLSNVTDDMTINEDCT